jgi:DUF971 family protein
MEADIKNKIPEAANIHKIYQKDSYTFTIEWSDGKVGHYRLSDLQKQCPCAGCVDETTGQRLVKNENIDDFVQARRLINVGRYALRIDFTSGCSTGIYSFDMLRKQDMNT